jgi:hypothetical protein
MSAMQKQIEDSVKGVLGDSGFAAYQEYQKSIGPRMAVDQVRNQLAYSQTPLQDYQSQQLLQIISEESAKVPAPPKDLSTFDSAKYIEAQQQTYQTIVTRSATILNPEQNKTLASTLENQLNMTEMGLKMSKEFYGQGSNSQSGPK